MVATSTGCRPTRWPLAFGTEALTSWVATPPPATETLMRICDISNGHLAEEEGNLGSVA